MPLFGTRFARISEILNSKIVSSWSRQASPGGLEHENPETIGRKRTTKKMRLPNGLRLYFPNALKSVEISANSRSESGKSYNAHGAKLEYCGQWPLCNHFRTQPYTRTMSYPFCAGVLVRHPAPALVRLEVQHPLYRRALSSTRTRAGPNARRS